MLASLAIQFSTTADVIERYLPQKLQEWGKLCISGDSEIVRASDHAELDPDASRDATFIRVSRCLTRLDICDLNKPDCRWSQYTGLVDRNAHQRNRPVNHVHVNLYGQVETFFSVPLPAAAELELDEPFKVVVAAIRKVRTSLKTPLSIPYYSEMGGMEVVDISVIKCLVGRIEDCGEWAIIDRTAGLARGDFS